MQLAMPFINATLYIKAVQPVNAIKFFLGGKSLSARVNSLCNQQFRSAPFGVSHSYLVARFRDVGLGRFRRPGGEMPLAPT